MAKIVTWICNILSSLVLVLVLSVVGVLLLPRALGYDMFAVLSGSMEPYYHVGSIVYVDKMPAEEIEVGDPIAFKLNETTIATHRVVEIDNENKLFTTKGDANDIVDESPVRFEQVIGKGTKSIPMLGYITVNIKSKKGLIVSCGIIVFLVILYIIPEILKPEKPKELQVGEGKET